MPLLWCKNASARPHFERELAFCSSNGGNTRWRGGKPLKLLTPGTSTDRLRLVRYCKTSKTLEAQVAKSVDQLCIPHRCGLT
jgi:hypothetical protein